jgi:hypothetical protein
MPANTAPAARKAARKPATARATSRTAKPAPAKAATARKKSATPATKTAVAAGPKTAPKSTRRTPAKTGAKIAPATARKRTSTPRRKTSRAPKPKAMEVLYSGKVFRSRLEARWAVFLDLCGINWDYEPCHYEIGPDLYYLPDFYLPDHRWPRFTVVGQLFQVVGQLFQVVGQLPGFAVGSYWAVHGFPSSGGCHEGGLDLSRGLRCSEKHDVHWTD